LHVITLQESVLFALLDALQDAVRLVRCAFVNDAVILPVLLPTDDSNQQGG
jgi:hypothetical protein